MKWLDGKKTYAGMALCGILGLLKAFGVVDDQTFVAAGSVLAAFTGVSLRAGIAKSGK